MPALTAADTLRILVATDSHVGFAERDPIRGNDSWHAFHEIMCLARERDVDMVLLAGDLFHENKPSRKAMYQVMRSLRMNCLGEKPVQMEVLGDVSESFFGLTKVDEDRTFNHVNYEDPDINVSIPVFSIHGNHDDPSGEGHLAALDILQVSGLINYYGRTPESDNIHVKPVLLQKGNTKLALYGLSNVRDERLFRTFRDGKVKFYQPGMQKEDWFNLIAVHQNHHAYTETGYLPENFLPEFVDLVIWGHEHECLIDPKYNPEMNFHVIQPGSSVATSLMPGEAVPKHVAVLSITGRDFAVEPIRLKSVRPFVMKEIVLSEDRKAKIIARKDNHRVELTRHLMDIVNELIAQANQEWKDAHDEEMLEETTEAPLPLIRLRVEYSAPDGGSFDCENPQRFSNRFVGKVANVNDVVQFYRKKAGASRRAQNGADLPEESILAQLSIDSVKVEKLVQEFLEAQSLTILPQNSFGDAVTQFVDKDDKHAMELFVTDSLENQVKHLLNIEGVDEEELMVAVEAHRAQLEELYAKGHLKRSKRAKLKPKPDTWDSDLDGRWSDEPGALIRSEGEGEDNEEEEEDGRGSVAPPARRGRGKAAAATSRKPAAPAKKKAAPAKGGRGGGKKSVVEEEESDGEEEDVVMVDSDPEESQSQLFVKPAAPTRAARKPPAKKAASPVKRGAGRPLPKQTQSRLPFSSQPASQQTQVNGRGKGSKMHAISDDEISDDEDAFEPVAETATARGTRSRR
ncbi:MAG: hypothetical protein LQ351_001494 [Letrouitia transgressa]|nr:MAG: hypothetical protein LQ351_001494 [Letrouitia transgressa]